MRSVILNSIIRIIIVLAFFSAYQAQAYRAARVASDQAEMKEGPSSESGTVTLLPKGTRLNTSDQATNGYYRARSATDLGWVQESDLQFTSGNSPAHKPPQKQVKEQMDDGQNSHDSSSPHPWMVKAFAGLDFWTPSDVNNLVGSTALSGGTGFGAEVDYGFSPNFFVGLRFEKLSKSSSGPAGQAGNQDQVTLELSSTPIMAALGWNALKGQSFSLDIVGYAGLGISTGVTETDTSQPAPNVSSMIATPLSYMLMADINWHITDPVWIFVEPGYRVLKTGQNNLTTQGNGSGLFTSNAQYVPFAVDMSGPVVNFGVRINL